MIQGFHRNKNVECGLFPHTKKLLDNPPKFPLDFDGPREKIGCTKFLWYYTSTTNWYTFRELYAQALIVDPYINEHSFQVTLCHFVRDKVFKRKCAGTGSHSVYIRVVKEPVIKIKKPQAKRIRKNRKVTLNNSW